MTFTDWIQAVCAFATAILAFTTFWQGRKIKTLTDIVNTLEKQGSIWQAMLSLETRSRIKEIQPIFTIQNITYSPSLLSYVVLFRNLGLLAKGVGITGSVNISKLNILHPTNKTVEKEEGLQIQIYLDNESKEYFFELIYNDGGLMNYKQKVRGKKHSIFIEPPSQIE
jgi:hypothetical protein